MLAPLLFTALVASPPATKDYMGGDARYDKSFDEAPKALRAHAEKVWAALTR